MTLHADSLKPVGQDSRTKIKALQNELTEGTVFCANDPCDSPATDVIMPTVTPVCFCCKTAYSWGQGSPDSKFVDIETIEAFIDQS